MTEIIRSYNPRSRSLGRISSIAWYIASCVSTSVACQSNRMTRGAACGRLSRLIEDSAFHLQKKIVPAQATVQEIARYVRTDDGPHFILYLWQIFRIRQIDLLKLEVVEPLGARCALDACLFDHGCMIVQNFPGLGRRIPAMLRFVSRDAGGPGQVQGGLPVSRMRDAAAK